MEREKVELLLDKLADITTCPHSIQLCHEPECSCKDVKKCKFQAHIKCDCHHEKKVPVLELKWLHAQRTKRGEKYSCLQMMSTDDKPETEKQRMAEKRRCENIEAERKRRKKQEDQEQLLMNNEVELEEYEMEEHDLGNQEMEEEEEEDMFALSSVMVKEQEEEARRRS